MVSVTLVEYDPQARTINENLAFIEERLRPIRNSLVILPEFCLSSYFFYDFINKQELPRLFASLKKLCHTNNLGIVGSIPLEVKGKRYNSGFYLTKENILFKNKANLFEAENKIFTPGRTCPIFTFQEISFCLQVCMDIANPLPSFKAAQKGIQLIINSATASLDFLRTINKARSLENHVVSVFCNRRGQETNGIKYLGRSTIFFPNGNESEMQKSPTLTVEIPENLMPPYICQA